jgi:CubicO group peptidase (beta-lactamase class C family)
VPVNSETVFRVGSVTKQFTALSILQLVEKGKIGLEDEITKLLPDYPTQGHRVTIHHLLTHTSGIKSYTSLGEEFWGGNHRLDLTHEQLLDLFTDEPFDFAPGEKWLYNNSGFYLLGMIVEKASGETYPDYIKHHIFEPLGMTGSMYCNPRALVPHRARGYQRQDGKLVNAEPLSLNPPGGAGAICSTPLDLLRWQRALDSNTLISATSRKKMVTESMLNDGSGTGYAYGLGVGTFEGRRSVSHGGGINGFVVAFDTYPDDELVVVVFSNTGGANSGRVAQNIARLILGIPFPVMKDLPMPSGWRAEYPGTYEAMGQEMRVWAEGDSLMMSAGPLGTSRLLYQGEGKFVLASNGDIALRFTVEGGQAKEVVILAGGQEIHAPRK